MPTPVLADARTISSSSKPMNLLTSSATFVGIGVREVDLVDHGDDGQVLLQRQVDVGHRLGFDALRRVDDEQRAFAGGQAAADLVGEVDVAGGVDQVEFVGFAVARGVAHAHGAGLDGDALLALEIHRVEQLRLHLPLATVPVCSSSRSASVDLPWSMCAMMQKLRIREISLVVSSLIRSQGRPSKCQLTSIAEAAVPAVPSYQCELPGVAVRERGG